MKAILLAAALLTVLASNVYSQGASCSESDPFCTADGAAFPASTSTTAQTGPDYGCLGDQPNPAWYYLRIGTAGNIDISLTNSANVDIDFICWGPYTNPLTACNNLTGGGSGDDCSMWGTYPCGNTVDCSFDIASDEEVNIPNAQVGQIYMLLITNFSGDPTNIFAEQIGGNGATDCSIVTPCDIVTLNATAGPCNASDNYTITGSFSYQNAPTSGSLVVVANNGTNNYTQTFNPPFTNGQTFNFSIPNVPGNGAATTVTAGFTATPSCSQTVTITAPSCVTPECDILTLTAVPGDCDANQNYALSGTFSYVQNPGTGTLNVVATSGGNTYTQTFNPPFTDNQVFDFNIPDIPGTGGMASVTVIFSDKPACKQTVTYTAPICVCHFSAGTYTLTDCDADSSYIFAGTLKFINSPTTGSLIITVNGASGAYTQTFNAPFTDDQLLSFSIPGIYADGLPASASAVFTDDQECVYNFQPFSAPECHCEVDASFIANPNVLTLENTSTQLINTSDNAISYEWTFDDNSPPSYVEHPFHTFPPDSIASYTVQLVGTSLLGCTDTVTAIVVVEEGLLFYVPNSFTPDGDEHNQMFQPVFTTGYDPYNFELLVFNRWGEVVFESHDANKGWDGTYGGKLQKEGVYTWTISYKIRNKDDRQTARGHVNLLR
jgi:gliding motility-associated-like protein